MEWWRNYLVRYLLGNIVGAVIVAFYLKIHNCFHFCGLNEIGDMQRLIVYAVLGFGFCYIASVPILVFHALRNVIYSFPDTNQSSQSEQSHKENIFITLFPLYFAILAFILSFFLPAVYDWYYHEVNIRANASNVSFLYERSFWSCSDLNLSMVNVQRGVLFLLLSFFSSLSLICFIIRNREKYASYLTRLAEARRHYLTGIDGKEDSTGKSVTEKSSGGDFIDSYRHLREHGNAFFIVLCEIVLAYMLFYLPMQFFLVCVILWITPGACIWWLGCWIEGRFAERK